jgi:hypothetical protein
MNRREKGAASVLVVFMMILLVTFGSMALSMGLANNRLGLLSTAWMQDYYAMDDRATAQLLELDRALNAAEITAQAALLSGGTADFAEVYAAVARQNAAELAPVQDWTIRETDTPEEATDAISSPLFIVAWAIPDELQTAERAQDKYLLVEIAVYTPAYQLTPGGGWVRDESARRFAIQKWQEWQEAFELKDVIEFWDGSIPS